MVRRILVVVGVVMALASCGGVEVSRGPVCGETQQEHLECLREVGFASIDGLEVAGLDKEQGMDTLVRFQFEGSGDSIDRALEAAEFNAAMEPGSGEFQLGPEVDLARLDDVRSASDVWVDIHDVSIHRQLLRGELRGEPGLEVLYVRGFTT